MTLEGDAPVVAEIIRVATGGEHPAHPWSACASLRQQRATGPAVITIRAYPIRFERGDVTVSEHVAKAFGVQLLQDLGVNVDHDLNEDEI